MNFAYKFKVFVELFFVREGWKRVIGEGLKNTLLIAILGLAIGIVIGTLIAIVRVVPKYKTMPKVLNGICTVYVGFFRGTPIVVQLLIAYYVLFPIMGISISSLATCILVFGLNSGAYVSEIMRGGINSVDKGQMEAGRALGLGYGTTMIKVVIPQAKETKTYIENVLEERDRENVFVLKALKSGKRKKE